MSWWISEERQWSRGQYEDVWKAWEALLITSNAIRYGFSENLIPIVGTEINVEKAKEHIREVERKWAEEARGRDQLKQFTGSPNFSAMPINAQLWLHKQLGEK